MKWIELSATVEANLVDQAALILGQYSKGGAVIEDWTAVKTEKAFIVRVYLPYNFYTAEKKGGLEQELQQLSPSCAVQFRERPLEQDEWIEALKKHFDVMEVGSRLIVRPSWHKEKVISPGKFIIELDPGMAFGTGHHQTTRMCLLRLERHIKEKTAVLDLGSGSGILAIAAALLGAFTVLALDNDPIAVKVARSNVLVNGVSDIVQVKKGTLSSRTRKCYRERFDLVVANLTSRVISDLSLELAAVLKPGGTLIVSGINAQGLDEVLIRLAIVDLTIEAIDTDGEWHAVVALRKS